MRNLLYGERILGTYRANVKRKWNSEGHQSACFQQLTRTLTFAPSLGRQTYCSDFNGFLEESWQVLQRSVSRMPSPVGHALGGLVAAFVVDSFVRRPRLTLPILSASAAMSLAPDLDLLAFSHRTYTHSIGAVALVGIVSWLLLRARHSSPAVAAVLTAAYASHLALDLLSKDTSWPSGLTALWPFTTRYYKSGLDLFGEISRRYWLPEEFVLGNIKAAGWEVAVVGPWLLLAWVFWSSSTLKTKNEERKTKNARPTR
jgi:membrane-bound metal-dependent hydrolase YbcI (DUF457 family)